VQCAYHKPHPSIHPSTSPQRNIGAPLRTLGMLDVAYLKLLGLSY
jgi:hypothetical protein